MEAGFENSVWGKRLRGRYGWVSLISIFLPSRLFYTASPILSQVGRTSLAQDVKMPT